MSAFAIEVGYMIECSRVADFFLSSVEEEAGDSLSNLKLQKLVYYAQGLNLALYDKALFKEKIMAWAHGPVVPDLYHRYKGYGSGPIPRVEIDRFGYDENTRQLLDEVWTVYGQFSASRLRNMTHEESPWMEAWNAGSGGGEITTESMRRFFKSQLAPEI